MNNISIHLSVQAKQLADELEKKGVSRVDFIREFYHDMTSVLTYVAFDIKGECVSLDALSQDGLYFWSLDTLTLNVHTPPEEGLYSYSPKNHTVMEVGDIDTGYYFEGYEGIRRDSNALPFPSPVLDENYEDIIQILTWQPDLSNDIIKHYATHNNVKVRKAVATNPNSPSDILEQLAKDSEESVRIAVAKNPALSKQVYELLTQEQNIKIKAAIAENPKTPEGVLIEMVKPLLERLMLNPKQVETHDEYLLKSVVNNENFPIDVLLEWHKYFSASEKSEILTKAIANHPKISLLVATELSQHSSIAVRQVLAKNPKTPLEILVSLTNDKESSIYREAIGTLENHDFGSNLSWLNSFVEKHSPTDEKNLRFYSLLTWHRTVPATLATEVLLQLPRDDVHTRYRLAAHKHTPQELVEELAQDETEAFNGSKVCDAARKQLAERKSLEEKKQIFWENVQRENGKYSYQTLNSDFAPADFLLSIIQDSLPDLQDEQRSREGNALRNPNFPLDAIINHSRSDLRQYVATKAKTTARQLEQLSKDPAWQVRMEVGRNLNTPPDVLEILAADEHPSVRGAVRQNLATPRHLLKRGQAIGH